ncbi:MAG: hypothetical protein SGARI_003195, partial [Bacillariaceae sp.]
MRLFRKKPAAVKVDWENSTEIHTHGQEPVVISYNEEDQANGNGGDTEAAWAGDAEAMAMAQEEASRRQACLDAYKKELSEAEGCQGCLAGEAMMDTMNGGEDPEEMPPVLQDSSQTRSRSNSMDSAPSIEDARGMSSIRDGNFDSTYQEPAGQEWTDSDHKKEGRSKLKWALIACASVLLILLIVMGVLISKNKKKEQDELVLGGDSTGVVDGENPVEEEDKDIFEEGLKECEGKEDFLIYTSCEAFSEPGSPQWKAWNWLTSADEANVSVEAGARELEVQERFAAATIFYATRGENWDSDLGFLSAQSI